MNQGNSAHCDLERCIVDTWIVDEVRKAVGMGYRLVEVFEFFVYGAFAEYKHVPKIETGNIRLPIVGSKYIEDYWRAQGIALDNAPISKNVGQRN
jgi:hypothetical protein